MHSNRLPISLTKFVVPTNFLSHYLHLLGRQISLPIFLSHAPLSRRRSYTRDLPRTARCGALAPRALPALHPDGEPTLPGEPPLPWRASSPRRPCFEERRLNHPWPLPAPPVRVLLLSTGPGAARERLPSIPRAPAHGSSSPPATRRDVRATPLPCHRHVGSPGVAALVGPLDGRVRQWCQGRR